MKPTLFVDHVYLGCIQRECQPYEDVADEGYPREDDGATEW